MPLLPTYDSKLDTIQPKANTAVTTQPFQGGGEESKVGAKATGELADTMDKFIEIKDTMEYTKVTANAEVAIAKQKLAAAQDPNPDNAQFHIDELQKIKKDATKGFTNKFTAQKVGMELDHKIEVGSLEIGGEFFKKKLFANKVNLDTTIDTMLQEKISTTDPNRKAEIDQKILALVQTNYAAGLITKGEADNYIDTARTMSVKYDIYNDQSTTEKESQVLKDLNSKDKYPDLTAKERLELKGEAQRRIFQNNQSYKKQIDNNEDAITARFADPSKPKPSEDEIVDLMNADQLTPKFARATIENIKSMKEKKENTSAEFAKIVDYIVTPGNKPEDIRIEIMRQEAMGNIDRDEFNMLYTFNQNASNKEIDKASPQKNFIQTLTFWSDENAGMKTTESKSRMFKDYMMQVNEGIDPEVAVKAAIKREIIKLHPQAATYPEEGQLVYDIMGNIKLIKPDGQITNPKQKSK